MRAEPTNRLDPRIKRVWRTSAIINIIIAGAIALIICGGIWSGLSSDFSVSAESVDGASLAFLVVCVCIVVSFILFVGILPQIRYIRWKFEVAPDELDILKGIIFRQRIIVPLVRVQNVDTKQGPILRMNRLSSVTISTAAGSHEIPGLSLEEADALRDKVAMLARLAQEDV